MPRCFSSSIQSEVACRAALRPLTVPASRTAPPNSSSFSVRVVLPASGWEMIRERAPACDLGEDFTVGHVGIRRVLRRRAVAGQGAGWNGKGMTGAQPRPGGVKTGRRNLRPGRRCCVLLTLSRDVSGLQALRTLLDFEADGLSFGQAAESG